MDRRQLRQQMRQARRQLSPQQQQRAAQQLAQVLRSTPTVRQAKRIAVYLASDGEIETHPFIRWAINHGKAIYLPVLHPVRHNRLWFVRYHPGNKMQRNRYGIQEPDPRYSRRIEVWGLDLVLLPLVAFDPEGGRLGMGGGYYDRTFAYRRHLAPFQRPRLIGLAHQLQQVDKLSIASWDIPLSGIATDQRYYQARKY